MIVLRTPEAIAFAEKQEEADRKMGQTQMDKLEAFEEVTLFTIYRLFYRTSHFRAYICMCMEIYSEFMLLGKDPFFIQDFVTFYKKRKTIFQKEIRNEGRRTEDWRSS